MFHLEYFSINVLHVSFSFQKSFENVFSIPFFIQFLVSGAILCCSVFQIVMVFGFYLTISLSFRNVCAFLDEST